MVRKKVTKAYPRPNFRILKIAAKSKNKIKHKKITDDKLEDIVFHNHNEIHGRIYHRLLVLEDRVKKLELESKGKL